MTKENDKVREVVEKFYDSELAKKIISAFDEKREIKYPHSVWRHIERVLRLNQHYTLGLSGKIGFGWHTETCDFPNIIITNRLTNPNIYVVDHNVHDNLTVIAFGKDSSLYSGLGSVLEVRRMGERSNDFGINIEYERNKKMVSTEGGEKNGKRKLWLDGDMESGFILSHKDKKLYSIDNVDKIF